MTPHYKLPISSMSHCSIVIDRCKDICVCHVSNCSRNVFRLNTNVVKSIVLLVHNLLCLQHIRSLSVGISLQYQHIQKLGSVECVDVVPGDMH